MKILKGILASALLFVLTFGFALSAKAMDIRTGQTIRITPDQQTYEEMLIGAGELHLGGTLNNNLIAGATFANITGQVRGDLNLAAGTIDLSGEVSESARLIGGTVKIKGKVHRNLIVVGGTVEIADKAEVLGDVVVFGGTLKMYGKINGDLRFSGGSVLIAGTLNSNAGLNSSEITIASTAHIKGDLNYTSTNAATIQNGAKIDGQSTYRLSQKQDLFSHKSASSLVISGIAYLILALLIVILLPTRILAASDTLKTNFWLSGLLGLLAVILVPILVLLFLITVVGAPTAVILLTIYLLLFYLAKVFVAVSVGQMVLKFIDKKREPSAITSMIVGLVLILVAINIPYLGYAIAFVINVFGIGALLLYLYNLRKTAKAFKLI